MTVLDSEGNAAASYFGPERSTEAAREALRRARAAAGFSPDFVLSDDCPIYNRGLNVLGRRTKHVRAHFEGKLVPYGDGVILISNNRIEPITRRLPRRSAACGASRTWGATVSSWSITSCAISRKRAG